VESCQCDIRIPVFVDVTEAMSEASKDPIINHSPKPIFVIFFNSIMERDPKIWCHLNAFVTVLLIQQKNKQKGRPYLKTRAIREIKEFLQRCQMLVTLF
jgi:hypothetical protein